MKILIITHFFPPETGAASVRMQYFVKSLTNERCEIQIIAPYPSYGIENFLDSNQLKELSKKQNVKYLHIFNPKTNDSVLERFISYLSFFFSSIFYSIRLDFKPDVVLTSSPPIFTAYAALIISKLKKAKFVFDVRDIWPDIGVQLGILKNNFFIKGLYFIERQILRSADEIIVTADGDKKNVISKGAVEERIEVIYNGADTNTFKCLNISEKVVVRKKYNLPLDKKLLIYFGSFNYGMNDIELLADSLIQLSKQVKDFHFVSVGSGSNKSEFRRKIESGVNSTFFDSLSSEKIAELLAACDISLIPRKFIESDTGGNIPVKCFESWACGVPVVLSTIKGSEIENIFNNCSFGRLCEAGNIDQFTESIIDLLNNPPTIEKIKESSAFTRKNFDRRVLAEKLTKIILVSN